MLILILSLKANVRLTCRRRFWQIPRRPKTSALPKIARRPAPKAVGCERLLGRMAGRRYPDEPMPANPPGAIREAALCQPAAPPGRDFGWLYISPNHDFQRSVRRPAQRRNQREPVFIGDPLD